MVDIDDAAAGRTANGGAMTAAERLIYEKVERLRWESEYKKGFSAQEVARRCGAQPYKVRLHLKNARTAEMEALHKNNRTKIVHLYRLANKTWNLIDEMRSAGVNTAALSPMCAVARFCAYGYTQPLSLGLILMRGGRNQAPEAREP